MIKKGFKLQKTGYKKIEYNKLLFKINILVNLL